MVTVDGVDYPINKEITTIYQFLYSKGIVLPCFCYHEKLSIAGNCRMCLVEANNAMVVSCAMPLLDKMIINTTTQRLLHARENVMEFLLANHPLDCPVCDQGGECDLQDISKTFGLDRGRFYEKKRSVDNLNCFGPMVKTIMTRCIHCTRCVRFLTEYGDIQDLGVIGRGKNMEIGTYTDQFINDELCGNIIDLCPVGALTSMPYAFTARPWELKSIESIDVLDALASSIRLDVAGNRVVRTLPILTETVNEDWLTNKARFSFDALNVQRIHYPQLNIANKYVVVGWVKAISLIVAKLQEIKSNNFIVKLGAFVDLETTWSAKLFFNSIGLSNISYQQQQNWSSDFRSSFLLNISLFSLEKSNLILLLASNLRMENPLINSRIRKNYLNNSNLKVFSLGLAVNYTTFPITNLGNTSLSFMNLCNGKLNKTKFFAFKGFVSLQNFNYFHPIKPLVLIGSGLILRKDFYFFNQMLLKFSTVFSSSHKVEFYNLVSDTVGRLSLAEIGLTKRINSYNSSLSTGLSYNIGTEDIDKVGFTIYQGAQFSSKSGYATLLLPTCLHTERVSTYLNLQGKLRVTKIAITPYKQALTDIEVFKLLFALKSKIIDNNFSSLVSFDKTTSLTSNLISYDCFFTGKLDKFLKSFVRVSGFDLRSQGIVSNGQLVHIQNNKISIYNSLLTRTQTNYYSNDQFVRLSKIMSLCASKVIISHFANRVAK